MRIRLLSLCLAAAAPVLAQAGHSTAPSPAAVAEFRKGTAALHADRPDEAAQAFEQVTRESPQFAEAYLNLGLALSELERDEEAARALEQAIRIKPSLRGAHLFLAIAEYKAGRAEPAASAIRRETALDGTNAQAWMWQGIIDLALDRLAASVDDLNKAASLDPNNVDILYHRGRAALALSRQSYEAMFKADPHSWHVHQVLAEADVESANDADAIEQFKAAIAGAPPQSGLYEALGSAYWRVGKYPEAQGAYEQAIKIDPADVIAAYKLGCLRVDRSEAAAGKPLLEQVRVADPSLTMTSYYLGRAELQLGDDQAAIADFERTIKENLDDDTTKQAWFQLSRVYRHQHNLNASAEAQAQYRLLDQRSKDALQVKLNRQRLRADRDVSIPRPSTDEDAALP